MANEFKVKNGVITPAVFNTTNSDLAISVSGTGKLKLNGLNWPAADGTANYVLKTDGSGNLSWAAGGGGASALDDLTDVVITSASNGQVLKYNGTNWVNDTASGGGASAVASASLTTQDFTGNGTQTVFTLTTAPTDVNFTFVAIDGVFQNRGYAYSVSGTTLTFTESPPLGALIEVTTLVPGIFQEQFCCTNTSYTLNNVATLQKIFNVSTNGAVAVSGSTSYFFECSLNLSGMSATSGNMGFSIGGAGTATFTSAAWHSFGLDATTQTTAAATSGIYSSSSAQTGDIVLAGVGTAASVYITGLFRITSGGTIIPSLQLTTASATATVGANSWFRCRSLGSNTVTAVGTWT